MQHIIGTHASALPAFGFTRWAGPKVHTAIILTTLVEGKAGDCSAYQAIVLDTSIRFDYTDAFKEEVAAQGNKISEKEARTMFDIGNLRYRS